jgi:serine protease inhibitor
MKTMLTAMAVSGLAAGMALGGGRAVSGQKVSADQAALVKGNTEFALDLYRRVQERPGNLFLSPYSISSALSMTCAGARGQTATQMAGALRFTLADDRLHSAFADLTRDLNAGGQKGDYQLTVANALWGQKGYAFLKSFTDLNQKYYGAGLRDLDFQGANEEARRTINAWVEKETREKIKDLIKQGMLPQDARLVLTNAIYFKGLWASQFKKQETRDAPFRLTADKTVNVPMMNQTEEFGYAQFNDYQALELPYKGEALSMVVMLPKKVDGLAEFEKSLDLDRLEKCFLSLHKQKVIVSLPKFTTTAEFSLRDALVGLGMADAFDINKADFSGMTGGKDLFIGAVVHKAFVDVNEEGTEAAAATGVIMRPTAVMLDPPVFRADHPFLFLIRDVKSGSVLFIGRVADPKP